MQLETNLDSLHLLDFKWKYGGINLLIKSQQKIEQFVNRVQDDYDHNQHYWQIGIIGSQSSGKSTLMNKTFGTSF